MKMLKNFLIVTAVAATIVLDVAILPVKSREHRQEHWWYHYGMSYRDGKHWTVLNRPFTTLEECLQFVGQGPWAKGEHCDMSRG